jgi:hypothetical protein
MRLRRRFLKMKDGAAGLVRSEFVRRHLVAFFWNYYKSLKQTVLLQGTFILRR